MEHCVQLRACEHFGYLSVKWCDGNRHLRTENKNRRV